MSDGYDPTGQGHNPGSKHYEGQAGDVRVRDRKPEEVDAFIEATNAKGIFNVRDERTRPPGQGKWTGPHVHLEYNDLGKLLADVPDVDPLEELLESVPAEQAPAQVEAPAAPSKIEALPGPTFDPRKFEDRRARDAGQQGIQQPGARQLVKLKVEDPARVSVPELMSSAMVKGASQFGVPEDFARKWIEDNPRSKEAVDVATGRALTLKDLNFNTRDKTITLAIANAKRIAAAYEASQRPALAVPGTPIGEAYELKQLLTDPSTSPGEKVVESIGRPVGAVARGLGIAARPATAGIAGMWAAIPEYADAVVGRGAPDLSKPAVAAYKQFTTGKTTREGENPYGQMARESETLRDINPNLPTVAGVIAEGVTDPLNILSGGAAGAVVRQTARGARLLDKVSDVATLNRGMVAPRPLGLVDEGADLSRLRPRPKVEPPPFDVAAYERRNFGEPQKPATIKKPETIAEYEDRVFRKGPDMEKAVREYEHTVFGRVKESAEQARVPKGSVRVEDAAGASHVIQKPKGNGRGNNLAVPVKATPAQNDPLAELLADVPDAAPVSERGVMEASKMARERGGVVAASQLQRQLRLSRADAEALHDAVLAANPDFRSANPNWKRPAPVEAAADDELRKLLADVPAARTPAQPQGALDEALAAVPPAPTRPASEFINLNKLNVSDEEKAALAGLVEQRVKETGYTKGKVAFEDIKREAAALDPKLVDDLKVPKDGATLNPAVRYAAKQRLEALNSEAYKLRRQIAEQGNALPVDELDALEGRATLLESDAKQLLDVLIPTRTNAGRALAFERMMVDRAGFDVEHWIAKGRQKAKRSGVGVESKHWQKRETEIRSVLASGKDAEAKLSEIEGALQRARAATGKALAEASRTSADPGEVVRRARRITAEGYKAKLLQMETEARARLKEKLGANVLHDVSDIGSMVADISVIGAAKLARKGIDRAVWARELVEEFGEVVTPHLRAIYQRSYSLYKSERASSVEAARTLRLTGGDPSKFTTDEIESLLKQAEVERSRTMRARVQLARTFAQLEQTHWATAFSSFGKAGLLGQVGMIARDVVGTTGQQAVSAIERVPASVVDMVVGAVTRRRTITSLEVGAIDRSLAQALVTGGKEAVQILRHGATREQLQRMELPAEINTRSTLFNLYVNGVMRVRTAGDNVFVNFALRRSLEDRARALALTEVKEGGLPRGRVRARTAELVADPPEDLAAAAILDAEFYTYHKDNVAARITRAAKAAGGPEVAAALDLVIPFVQYGGNAVKMIFYDYTPASTLVESLKLTAKGGGAVVAGGREGSLDAMRAAFRASFSPEDQRKFALSFGRGSATGSGLALSGYVLYKKGYVTGMRPDSEGQRETQEAAGRPPLSIYNPLTKTWHSFGWLGPWGVTIGLGALWAESEGDEDRFKTVAGGVKEILGQLPLLRAAKQTTDLLTSAATDPAKLGNNVGRIAARFIPSPSADFAALTDGTARRPKGFVEQLSMRVPGLRSSVTEDRDVYDREVEASRSDVIDPFKTRTVKSDPVDEEFVRLKVGVVETNREKGETEEAYKSRKASQGAAMDAARRAAVASDSYKSLPDDETKREALQAVISYARAERGLTREKLEHNAVVTVERARLRVLVKRESGLSDEQRKRAYDLASGMLDGAVLKAKDDERTRADAAEELSAAVKDVSDSWADILAEAREP